VGRVVGVTDGDTIRLLDEGKTQHVVRLGSIDAPERGQPFGRAAKDALSTLAFDLQAEARCWKRDRYGREVCAVFVGGRDVGLEMVREGQRPQGARVIPRALVVMTALRSCSLFGDLKRRVSRRWVGGWRLQCSWKDDSCRSLLSEEPKP